MPIEMYAFLHFPEVAEESTSGGAFSAIAEAFFCLDKSAEKVVYGVTLNQDMNVAYNTAYSLEECYKFRGSKYVQVSMQGVSGDIAQDLQNGKYVLFVGTPCCVYALKTKLNNAGIESDHLFCVDLICHGTPDVRYWNAYKQWLEERYSSKLIGYKFRTKQNPDKPYTALAVFEDGKCLAGSLETAIYNRLFLRNYTLCQGCFSCRFANLDRQGDLTIGDFWGIEDVMPEFPQKKGISEILVNTKKGSQLTNWMIMQYGWHMQCCNTMNYVKYQNNLQKPAEKPIKFDEFVFDFRQKGFGYVAKKYAGYDLLHRIKFNFARIMDEHSFGCKTS